MLHNELTSAFVILLLAHPSPQGGLLLLYTTLSIFLDCLSEFFTEILENFVAFLHFEGARIFTEKVSQLDA